MTESEKGPWKNHSSTPSWLLGHSVFWQKDPEEKNWETTVFTCDHSLFALGLSSTCILRVFLGLKEKREDGKRKSTPHLYGMTPLLTVSLYFCIMFLKTITTFLPHPFPLGFLFRCGRLTTCISLLSHFH